jgi:hypothetical protein
MSSIRKTLKAFRRVHSDRSGRFFKAVENVMACLDPKKDQELAEGLVAKLAQYYEIEFSCEARKGDDETGFEVWAVQPKGFTGWDRDYIPGSRTHEGRGWGSPFLCRGADMRRHMNPQRVMEEYTGMAGPRARLP